MKLRRHLQIDGFIRRNGSPLPQALRKLAVTLDWYGAGSTGRSVFLDQTVRILEFQMSALDLRTKMSIGKNQEKLSISLPEKNPEKIPVL